jgi:hypothetical protein
MTTTTDNDQHIHDSALNTDSSDGPIPAQSNTPDDQPPKKRPNACTLSAPKRSTKG